MKKLLAIVMVVAMMFSMSVIAGADQTATITYDEAAKTAVITINTTAFETFDVGVISEATCVKAEYDMGFGMSVVMNTSEYTYSGVANAAAVDDAGNTYACLTGAGCTLTNEPIPYEGVLGTLTYENVEPGTEFVVVTGTAAATDVTALTPVSTLVAEADPVPTESEDPVPTESEDPVPTESEDPVPTESEDPAPAPSESAAPAPSESTAPTTPSDKGDVEAPKTADVAPIATMITLVVVAGLAIVALKKRATN